MSLQPMTLSEVLLALRELDGALTIFCEGGLSGDRSSRAIICEESESGAQTCPDDSGLTYLLEVDTAIEVIEVWSAWRDGRSPTPQERVEAVLYYAANDAFLPT